MTSSTADRPRLCLTFWFAAFGAGDSTQLKILTVDSESRAERGLLRDQDTVRGFFFIFDCVFVL